jgi:acyl transferase domain-containing protein/acyl carrier protein
LYVAGYSPDWDAFYPRGSFRALPRYPWQRERYWKEAEGTRRDRLGELEHSLLGDRLDVPLPTWRRHLDGSRPGYLADHRVMDANVFPGAGYVEMALAAGRAVFGVPRCALDQVQFEAPVILRQGPAYMLDTTVDSATGRAAIYGRLPGGASWIRHASARLAPAAVCAPVLDLDAIRARCGDQRSGSQFYKAVSGHGFDYGPAFQSIGRIWQGEREAIGQLTPDALRARLADDLVLDPIALDACFQMMLPLIDSTGDEHAVLLPIGVDRIVVHGRPQGALWIHATAVKVAGSDLTSDAVLTTEDGHAVIEVKGFRARMVGSGEQARARLGNRWLHEVVWPAQDIAEGESVAGGKWLVFADRHGIADAFVGQLNAAGHRCIVVGPDERHDLRPVVSDMAARSDQPVRGVVYVSAADVAEGELTGGTVSATVERDLKSLLHLVQTLDAQGLAWPLTVVTVGAQPVDGRVTAAGLLQAPLWGMARVLHQESLALRTRMIDLDPHRPLDDIAALTVEVLRATPEEDQVAWRDGERRVARLQPSADDIGSVPITLQADASYLITGGLGSLGLMFAKWLVERGARRIVLLARSPLPPRDSWASLSPADPHLPVVQAITSIEKLGAVVETASLDVADEAALLAFASRRRAAHLPPMRGIIHAAGAVRDQVMVQMTDEQLEEVLRPKVLGAWSLHEAFAADPLDFFVLFSSVSSVLVTTGQSNYAAGNAFLDALAYHRRGKGLPALSINWGPWNAGMIAQLDLQPFYERRGIDLIPETTGVEILAQLVGSAQVQQVVVSAHWPTLIASYPIVPRLIAHLGDEHDHPAGGDAAGAQSIAERLADAPPQEHQRIIADACAEVIGGVLRIRPDNLSANVPLNQLGLDSMIAVEVRIRLEQAFGVAPKVVFLLHGTTITDIAAFIHENHPALQAPDTPESLAALLGDLSPEAAEAMLAQVQSVGR